MSRVFYLSLNIEIWEFTGCHLPLSPLKLLLLKEGKRRERKDRPGGIIIYTVQLVSVCNTATYQKGFISFIYVYIYVFLCTFYIRLLLQLKP